MKQKLKYLKNLFFGTIFFGGIIILAIIASKKDKNHNVIKNKLNSGDIIIITHKDNSIDTIIKN